MTVNASRVSSRYEPNTALLFMGDFTDYDVLVCLLLLRLRFPDRM